MDFERQTLHVNDDETRVAMVETKTIENGTPITTPVPRIRYQHSDHLGSCSVETSDTGALISFEEYYPYGGTSFQSTSSSSQVSAKRYRYNGKEKDEETNLYYYGARYYISWLGRWMSCDPIGEEGSGLNLYRYASNNPVMRVDPTGMADEVVDNSQKKDSEKQKSDSIISKGTSALQEKINNIQDKVKNNEELSFVDKLVLKTLYGSMVVGGKLTGKDEASDLLSHYLSGKGDSKENPYQIDSAVYEKSKIVQHAMGEMKKIIAKDLKDGKLDNQHLSSLGLLKNTPSRNQKTEGAIIKGGYLLAEQENSALKNTNNTFLLTADITQNKDGSVGINWSVKDDYSFESYQDQKSEKTNLVTELKFKGQKIKIDDGLSAYLEKVIGAKPFHHKAEWKEKWSPK